MNQISLLIHKIQKAFFFQADTEFDTDASVNSNGGIEGTSDLTVNAATSRGHSSQII